MNTTIYQKNIVKRVKGNRVKINVEEDEEKEIKSYMSDGCLELGWYILNSAIPEQVPYCPLCLKAGYASSVHKDGKCIYHKQQRVRYSFKELKKEQIDTNLEFVKEFRGFIATVCDASKKRFDDKKIIQGIININKNNDTLSLKSLRRKFVSISSN